MGSTFPKIQNHEVNFFSILNQKHDKIMWLLCRRWTRHGSPPCSWYHVWSCWRLDSSTCTAQSWACCPRPQCATRSWWSPTRFLDSAKVTWRLKKNLFCRGFTFVMFDIFSLFSTHRVHGSISQRRGQVDPVWEKLGETRRAGRWFGENLGPHQGVWKARGNDLCLSQSEGVYNREVYSVHWCCWHEAQI